MSYTLRPHQQQGVDVMSSARKGQLIMPTGSGKTMTMIEDAQRHFTGDSVTVVVSPRILLTQQLCCEFMEHITSASVMHVHSAHNQYFTTTKPSDIYGWCKYTGGDKLIFTTYHSLHRIQESRFHVDNIYFDESHNSIRSDFYPAVRYFATMGSDRSYFFTATPKHSYVDDKPGMNDKDVYGNVLINVSAPSMVSAGYILPPDLRVCVSEQVVPEPQTHSQHIIDSVTNNELDRALVCMKSTKQLIGVLSSDLPHRLREMEYDLYYITSRTGAIINGKKVRRDTFFKSLRNHTGKFILFHVRILSEGINLSNLDGCIILRSMNVVDTLQTIGRVIRLGKNKTCGKVVLPCYSKYMKRYPLVLHNIVRETFVMGNIPIQRITR